MQLEAIFACPDVSTRNGRRDQFFMIYAYETGGRIEELVNMKLGDIIRNGNSVQVRLHGKGDKTRYNPLPEEVIPYLDSYLSEFHPVGSNEDYLFYTIHGHQHTQMAPRTVNSFLAKYAAKLHEQDPNFPASLHCHVFVTVLEWQCTRLAFRSHISEISWGTLHLKLFQSMHTLTVKQWKQLCDQWTRMPCQSKIHQVR